MFTLLATPNVPAATDVPCSRGVGWVLRAVGATLAIAAWLTVLLHLALVVRAEMQLAHILRQSNAFADLPQVDSRELAEYAQRRLATAGLEASRVTVANHPRSPGKLRVARIEAEAAAAMPRPIAGLSRWLDRQPAALDDTTPKSPFLQGQ